MKKLTWSNRNKQGTTQEVIYTGSIPHGLPRELRIIWYDDMDNKMLICLADVDIAVACASEF
jgi:hypothetical protein